MSRVAIIGGDNRVLQAAWAEEVKPFMGDDSGRLVKSAHAGLIRGVIVLSRWMHAQLKNGIRSLPKDTPVVYYPGSINSLEKDYMRIASEKFPAPQLKVSIAEVLDAKPNGHSAKKDGDPVYIGANWEPLSRADILKSANGASGKRGGVNLWTKEEQEILMLARSTAEDELRAAGRTGAFMKGIAPLTHKLFVELGGNGKRSKENLGERHRRVRLHEEEQERAKARSASARVGAAKRNANRKAKAEEEMVLPMAREALIHATPLVRRKGDSKIALILRHVRDGVALGLHSKEEAFDALCAFLDRFLEG